MTVYHLFLHVLVGTPIMTRPGLQRWVNCSPYGRPGLPSPASFVIREGLYDHAFKHSVSCSLSYMRFKWFQFAALPHVNNSNFGIRKTWIRFLCPHLWNGIITFHRVVLKMKWSDMGGMTSPGLGPWEVRCKGLSFILPLACTCCTSKDCGFH
jgi:hypothetical protein